MAPLSPDFRSRGEERTDDLFDRFNVAVMNGTVGLLRVECPSAKSIILSMAYRGH